MKSLRLLALLAFLPFTAHADPTAFFGISWNPTSGLIGFSVNALSDDEENKGVASAGATYYPWAPTGQQLGLTLGAGYTHEETALLGSWDFIKKEPQVSVGYANTQDDKSDDNGERR
jgi:hypothetical protein